MPHGKSAPQHTGWAATVASWVPRNAIVGEGQWRSRRGGSKAVEQEVTIADDSGCKCSIFSSRYVGVYMQGILAMLWGASCGDQESFASLASIFDKNTHQRVRIPLYTVFYWHYRVAANYSTGASGQGSETRGFPPKEMMGLPMRCW